MRTTTEIHVACVTGRRDGGNFPLEDYEFKMNFFASQFDTEAARAAYCCNFIAAVGRRLRPSTAACR